MTKNPYNMKRKWTIEVEESESTSNGTSLREKQLEEKLQNIEKQFQEFQEQQNKILNVKVKVKVKKVFQLLYLQLLLKILIFK